MTTLTKEIEEMQKKAERYENLKTQYIKIAEEIDTIIEKLERLRDEIDPVRKAVQPTRKQNPRLKEIKAELIEMLQKGMQLTRTEIEEMYPEMTKIELGNMMTRIKELPNIDSTKDGVKVRIYMKKIV